MNAPRRFIDPGRPSLHVARSVPARMGLVLLALVPAIALSVLTHGPGLLGRLMLALAVAMALEVVLLGLRKGRQPIGLAALSDLSAPVTAVVFALALSPDAPWWAILFGITMAIGVAKHLFGGLGHNLFNPAMVGVAVVALLLPQGPAPFASGSGMLALAYALGGVFLLGLRVIPWQTPAAVLAASLLLAGPLWMQAPETHPSPWHHLASDGLDFAAFFIATDPVTGCSTPRGRLVFGSGLALITLAMHHGGGIQPAMPFAVLMMNAAAPLLDRLLRPRWLGEG